MNKIDKILIILAVYLVLFTATVFVIFLRTQAEPTMLVGGTVAAVVAEILALCRIKIGKERKEEIDNGNCESASGDCSEGDRSEGVSGEQ